VSFEMKHFITQNGERFLQLYQTPSDGFPLFYSSAYYGRNLRTDFSRNSQVNCLLIINQLYEWTKFYRSRWI